MPDGTSPLNMGAPWDAISGLGGGPSQGPGFGQELARAFQPQQGPSPQRLPGQEELQAALANMRDFQSRLVTQNQQNEQIKPPATIKVNTSDGTLDLGKVPIETYQAFMRDRQQLDEIRGAFHQEAMRLQMQEQQARQQPWAQLATALSANLANQPDMPGWVRGLGQTAAQLNPTADQLGARRMNVLGQEAQIAEKGTALNLSAGELASRELTRREMVAQHGETKAIASEKDRKSQVEKVYDDLASAISKGPGKADMGIIADNLAKAGATPEEIKTKATALGMLANNVSEKYAKDAKKEADAAQRALDFEAGRDERFRKSQEGIAERQQNALKQAEFTTANAAYKQNTSLSVQEQGAVQSAFTALNLVDKMSELDKSGKKGPISGKLQFLNPWRSGEWQQLKNYSDQLLLSGLNGKLGSGVSDMDVQVMRGVQPQGTMTQEQYNATVKILKTLNPDNLERLMALNPNVQYWKQTKPLFEKAGIKDRWEAGMQRMIAENAGTYPELFGPDRPAIADRIFGPDTKVGAPTVSGPAPGAKDSGGLHNKVTKTEPMDEVAAAKAAPIGKTVTIKGKTYRKTGENNFEEVK